MHRARRSSAPSSVIAWVQRTEGHSDSMSLRSGDVRTGKLIHQTAPPGDGDTLDTPERGYFIVTPYRFAGVVWQGRSSRRGRGAHRSPTRLGLRRRRRASARRRRMDSAAT
jgi:hypothetical protein